MAITSNKISRLRELEKEQKKRNLFNRLEHFDEKSSPNYKLLHKCITEQRWGFDENGKPILLSGYTGAVLEGSSRSTKTWSGVDIIIWLATKRHKDDGCTINIYRQTYNEFKTTLYDDFKRRLDDYGLDNPFHRAKEVSSFKIGKSTIHFLGDGKFGGGCDYAFFNEVMFIDMEVFKQVKMRCRYFWWMDFNPCYTDHWVFDSVIPRSDVAYLRTTFKDNLFISPNELNEILGYEPWLPGSYEVTEDDVLYNGESITEKNQPPPHPTNVKEGTASEFDWRVYGLGLRGALKGAIFQNVVWIDEFPKDIPYIYANDFGFTADPNVLGRYSEDEKNIYIEPLTYHPIETPEELGNELLANDVEYDLPLACDSSDKYTGENKGTVEMVSGIFDLGWIGAYKIPKTKSVMYWLLSMKKKKIHIVKNQFYESVKNEREKYRWMEINGIFINKPVDKDNHFWDMGRYGHMAWNSSIEVEWD